MERLGMYKRTEFIVAAIFTLIYSSISLVNHYLFRTYSFDLGLYNHTIFDYSQFRFNDSLLIEPIHRQRNQLSDHFDLMLMLISPLRYLFGTYTLLIVQITAIVAGGIAVNKIARHFSFKYPALAQLHFYVFWGIYSALAFDYHSNVVAAMLVPWLFLAVLQRKKYLVWLFAFLIAICKENMALWLVFILIGISLLPETGQSYKKMLRLMAVVMLAYFLTIVKLVMPALMPPGLEYIHLTFGKLGNGLTEILSHIILHPLDTFLLLFKSPYVNEPHTFWIKAETHVYLLLSGGALLLFRPQFLLMLLPVLAQKLLHDDIVKWGINLHYSIEFVPVLAIGSVYVISKITANDKLRLRMAIALVCISALLTFSSFRFRYSKWFDNTTIHFLHRKHYKQTFNVKEVHHIIHQIPAEYNVAASPNLTPHLAFRKVIYSFPMWDKVDVIVLLKQQESYFPYDKNRYEREIESLKSSPDFHIITETNDIIVFARKNVNFEIHP